MRLEGLIVGVIALSACGETPPAAPEQPPVPRFEQVSADPAEHGERLVAVLGCVGCHDPGLTGVDWTEPDMGVLWTANLTRSAQKSSADELATMITLGKRPDRALSAAARGAVAAVPRQALHAATRGFTHPVTGADLRFEAPLPGDMSDLLVELDRSDPNSTCA